MIFRHSTCGNRIYIDSGELIKIFSNVSCDSKSLRIGETTLNPVQGRFFITKFYCPNCNEEVKMDGLLGVCANGCDHTVKLEDLFYPVESGGIYCTKCIAKFKNEQLIPIKEIIGKIRYK